MASKANLTKKKISVRNVKLSDQPVGYTFSGKFKGIVEGQPFDQLDKKTGEIIVKKLRSVIIEGEGGERFAYLADQGLIQAITEAMVSENDTIEVVKLEKTALSKGRTMNQYDIFALS